MNFKQPGRRDRLELGTSKGAGGGAGRLGVIDVTLMEKTGLPLLCAAVRDFPVILWTP